MPSKTTGGDWLALRGKRVCLDRDRQSSSSGFGAQQQEVLYILAPAIRMQISEDWRELVVRKESLCVLSGFVWGNLACVFMSRYDYDRSRF